MPITQGNGQSTFLDHLTEPEREALLDKASYSSYPNGQILLKMGQEGTCMFVIEKGKVEVTRAGRVLATLGEGAVLGEMSLVDPAPRSATVTAKGEVWAYSLERNTLWELLAEGEPSAVAALRSLTSTVGRRLAQVNRLVEQEVVRPTKGQVNVFSQLWKKITGRAS